MAYILINCNSDLWSDGIICIKSLLIFKNPPSDTSFEIFSQFRIIFKFQLHTYTTTYIFLSKSFSECMEHQKMIF